MMIPPPSPSNPDNPPAKTPVRTANIFLDFSTPSTLVFESFGVTLRIILIALHINSNAVKTISKCPSPGTRGDTHAPTTAATTPLGAVNAMTRQRINSPWR